MSKPEPDYDTVVVLTEDELQHIEEGAIISKKGHQFANEYRPSRPWIVSKGARRRLRRGEAVNWSAVTDGTRGPVSAIHEDYAGTPKSNEVAAERLFALFREHEGEGRSVALEALHMLGYDVEKNVEYELVENNG